MKMFVKLIAFTAALAAAVFAEPDSLSGEVEADFIKGSGEKDDPYLIENEEHLNSLASLLHADKRDPRGKDTLYFAQTADIEWSGKYEWALDSLVRVFYDGMGHSISGVKIDRPEKDTVGFFPIMRKALVRDLTLKDFEVTGHDYVGMLAGYVYGSYAFNCRFYGKVRGNDFVGGIVGHNRGNLRHIVSNIDVAGVNVVGGALGASGYGIQFSGIYGSVKGDSLVGGFLGATTQDSKVTSLSHMVVAVDVTARVQGNSVYYTDVDTASFAVEDVFSKKRDLDEVVIGVPLEDEFLKSDAFLDSVPYTFVKGGEENSDGYPIPFYYKGRGTADEPFLIESYHDLIYFNMEYSGLYQSYLPAQTHFKLTTDVDMKNGKDYTWKAFRFSDYFDGGYHTVSRLKVVDGLGSAGFFGMVLGFVENLGIRNSYIEGEYAGAITGKLYGIVERCWNDNSTVIASQLAGGIAGVGVMTLNDATSMVGYSRIDRVYNTGSISATNLGIAAGIVGAAYANTYSKVDSLHPYLTNAYNRGKIRGDTTYNEGSGIMHGVYFTNGSGVRLTVESVYNTDDNQCGFIGQGYNQLRAYVQLAHQCTELEHYSPDGNVKSKQFMLSSKLVDSLGTAFEMDVDNLNDGYPILKGLHPRKDYVDEPMDPENPESPDFTIASVAMAPVLQVNAIGRHLEVDGLKVGSSVKLYSITGTCLYTIPVTRSHMTLPVNKSGYFIIRNGKNAKAVKVW